ncbi:MAG TPA: hypothetical protein VMF08_17290 [Candidatus Sulfotelmatobacter sp.]|nr:hypothetical protein [Candidatus Sulfotelmatobacter sp.]
MKKAFLFLALLVIAAISILVWIQASKARKAADEAAALAATVSPTNAIVLIHFAGAAAISSDPNSTAFTNIFCSAQARAMESQTLDKLSRAPGSWFKDKLPAGVDDGSAQLRPLLDDFLKSEWVFEMRDATPSPEYVLAVRLNDTRAHFWQANLRTLLESWTKIKAQDIPGGWELKKDMPPNLFRAVRAGNWLLVGCGQDELPLSDAWAGGTQPDENETNWASAKVNWPRLAEIFPDFAKFDLPAMQMQVVGRDGNLLPSGTFELSQPLPALEPWQIPTDMIHQPLTSFTAVRGFAPWLERQPWAKWLQLSPEPDQAFSWSLGSYPLEAFIAVPVTNSATALAQLGQNLARDTNWQNDFMDPFPLGITTNRVFLKNVPFAGPEVTALNDPAGDFLFADVFPNAADGAAPPQLLDELNKDNIVAYHWEITSKRLKMLPQLTQLALMLTQHRQLDAGSAAGQWLKQIGPTLGDCVTEVTQTGPAELAFTRSGRAGLTALELVALANWLEAPNFPGCDLNVPRPIGPRPHHPKKLRNKAIHPPLRQGISPIIRTNPANQSVKPSPANPNPQGH